MKKRTKLHLLAICAIAGLALTTVSFFNANSLAQGQPRKFITGEMIETGGGMFAKILRCRGAGENEECEIQYYRGNAPESTPRWENTYFLRQAEERVLESQRRQAGEQPETDGTHQVELKPAAAPSIKEENDAAGTAPGCSYETPPGEAGKTAKPSEQLFKRKIYDIYHVLANGTGSAPLQVGVTFLNFQLNKPFINVVHVDPGRGALRINDAAPPNATIYPVKSEHVVCEQYRDATRKRRIENKYACFKNRDGEWVCGADGIPKTTQLN